MQQLWPQLFPDLPLASAEMSHLTRQLHMPPRTDKLVCPVFFQLCNYIAQLQKKRDLFSNLNSVFQSWLCKPWRDQRTYIIYLTHTMLLTTHPTMLFFFTKVRLIIFCISEQYDTFLLFQIPSLQKIIEILQSPLEYEDPKQEVTWFSKTLTQD